MVTTPKTAISDQSATLISQLTSLRFFAAISVVVFHSGASFIATVEAVPVFFRTLLLNGYVGVTFFFVLSGFILQFVYSGRISPQRGVRNFAVARVARIYPCYILGLLLVVPFFGTLGWSGVPQFFLLQMWWPNLANWNMPAWTLSVELFFYLLFPFLSPQLSKLETRPLFIIGALMAGIIIVTGSSSVASNDRVLFAWMAQVPVPLLRLPEFIGGVAVGELFLRSKDWRMPVLLSPMLLTWVMLVPLCLSNAPRMAGFVSAMSMLLIFAVAHDRASLMARFLSWRPLVLLGGASYGLYLLQQPFHFAHVAFFGSSKLSLIFQYPILIVGSLLIFLYYEEPLRERIRHLFRMRSSSGAAIKSG